MAVTLQQQVSAATRSQIEGQLAAWTALNNALLEGVAKLAELNMQTVRESIDGSAALSRELFDSPNPQDFLAAATEQFQPNIERLTKYSRHVAEIANDVRADIGKVVQDEIAGANRQTAFAMKDFFGRTPSGSGPLADWMKNALDAANAGYEQLIGTTMQMTKAFGENLQTDASGFTSTGAQASAKARKK